MCPPDRVKRLGTPSFFRTAATRWPPCRGLSTLSGSSARVAGASYCGSAERRCRLGVLAAVAAAEPRALGVEGERGPHATARAGPQIVPRRPEPGVLVAPPVQYPEVVPQDPVFVEGADRHRHRDSSFPSPGP